MCRRVWVVGLLFVVARVWPGSGKCRRGRLCANWPILEAWLKENPDNKD